MQTLDSSKPPPNPLISPQALRFARRFAPRRRRPRAGNCGSRPRCESRRRRAAPPPESWSVHRRTGLGLVVEAVSVSVETGGSWSFHSGPQMLASSLLEGTAAGRTLEGSWIQLTTNNVLLLPQRFCRPCCQQPPTAVDSCQVSLQIHPGLHSQMCHSFTSYLLLATSSDGLQHSVLRHLFYSLPRVASLRCTPVTTSVALVSTSLLLLLVRHLLLVAMHLLLVASCAFSNFFPTERMEIVRSCEERGRNSLSNLRPFERSI